MTAFYKDQGISLYDALLDMYQQYGLYKETLLSITKKGKTGTEEIKTMMQTFRTNTPKSLGDSKVIELRDYEMGKQTNLLTGAISNLDFPKSDVLQFITADGSIISARPSGTEPKIKFYFSVNAILEGANDFDEANTFLDTKIQNIITEMKLN